jgi:hypothetical protein
MSVSFGAVAVTTMCGLFLYQLLAGKALDRGWNVWARKEEHPSRYWISIFLQSVIVFTGLALATNFIGAMVPEEPARSAEHGFKICL